MPLKFEIGAAGDARSLEETWRGLETRADAPFFLSWDWIGCWIGMAEFDPLLLTGRVNGQVVLLGLLLPSTRRDTKVWSTHGLRLQTTGDETRDVITIEYNGFLVERGWAGTAEREAIAFLMGGISVAGRRRDELHLRGVTQDYENLAPPGSLAVVVSRKPSWRIDLEGVRASGKSYLDHLSANTRQQIRRSVRLYEKRGKLDATRAGDVPEALSFLDGLKELHQRYWTARGEPGEFAYPFFERFVRRLIEHGVPRGTIELVRISCGAQPIGYLFNLVFRGQVYSYQSGLFYEDDPKLKPGLVSHYLCIERHIQEGARIYDFMAGDSRYKANMGKPGPEMLYILVGRPTAALQIEQALRQVKHRFDRFRRNGLRPGAQASTHAPDRRQPTEPAANVLR